MRWEIWSSFAMRISTELLRKGILERFWNLLSVMDFTQLWLNYESQCESTSSACYHNLNWLLQLILGGLCYVIISIQVREHVIWTHFLRMNSTTAEYKIRIVACTELFTFNIWSAHSFLVCISNWVWINCLINSSV